MGHVISCILVIMHANNHKGLFSLSDPKLYLHAQILVGLTGAYLKHCVYAI